MAGVVRARLACCIQKRESEPQSARSLGLCVRVCKLAPCCAVPCALHSAARVWGRMQSMFMSVWARVRAWTARHACRWPSISVSPTAAGCAGTARRWNACTASTTPQRRMTRRCLTSYNLEIDEPVEHLGSVRAAVTIVPQKHDGCSVQLISAQVGFQGLPQR